jgi:hypothetical protein
VLLIAPFQHSVHFLRQHFPYSVALCPHSTPQQIKDDVIFRLSIFHLGCAASSFHGLILSAMQRTHRAAEQFSTFNIQPVSVKKKHSSLSLNPHWHRGVIYIKLCICAPVAQRKRSITPRRRNKNTPCGVFRSLLTENAAAPNSLNLSLSLDPAPGNRGGLQHI